MKSRIIKGAVAGIALLLGISAFGQIYKYYTPGTVWSITTIRVKAGMDPAYLQYLDSGVKKESDVMIKAGYMKSYKILRTFDDDASSWNLLILREYKSLAALEADEEKADNLAR